MPKRPSAKKIKIMVSSSVYQKEPLLEQIYATLDQFGYQVWMSHKGTVPLRPGKSAYENCLDAVRKCDIFFCMIFSRYGSGDSKVAKMAITHRELLEAIKHDKIRYVAAHDNVVAARRFLKDLDYDTKAKRDTLTLKKGAQLIDDLRLIDMYEAATREDIPEVDDRTDNWVQAFKKDADLLLYVSQQFGNYQDALRLMHDKKIDEHRKKADRQAQAKGQRSRPKARRKAARAKKAPISRHVGKAG
ncbi:MAG TPA: DUF4062 domain-containing protein [Dongiaceae bacterium]|nr:DUF4062 domain-containing protein [Dongiaceae bacterium]